MSTLYTTHIDDETLTEGEDYEITYSGELYDGTKYEATADKPVNAGSYFASIALIDDAVDTYWLIGQTSFAFEIERYELTENYEWNNTANDLVYTGSDIDESGLPTFRVEDPFGTSDLSTITSWTESPVHDAGEYTAYVVLGTNDYNNYVLSDDIATYTFEVKKALITVTPTAGQSKVYGSPNPVLTYEADGFVGDDDEELLTGALTREAGEDVGPYDILLGSLSAGVNYTIKFVDGVFTIEPKDVTVTAIDKIVNYGDKFDPKTDLQSAIEGLIGNDALTITYELDPEFEGDAGTYIIIPTAEFADDDIAANYNEIKIVNGTLTVNKASLIVKADDQSILVGDDMPTADELTASVVSGLKGDDDESIIEDIVLKIDTDKGNPLPAGNYPIVENGSIELTNYDYTVLPGTLYVTAKPAAYASATNTVQTYGSVVEPTVTVKDTAGETLDASYYTVTYSGTIANGKAYAESKDFPTEAGSYIIKVEPEVSGVSYPL